MATVPSMKGSRPSKLERGRRFSAKAWRSTSMAATAASFSKTTSPRDTSVRPSDAAR